MSNERTKGRSRPDAARGESIAVSAQRQPVAQREQIRKSADRLGLKVLPKRPSTKEILIDVGEVVIGRNGIEGVTLREIGLLAGQSNSNVVQYHFNNKEGLINAILEDRAWRKEEIRARQLRELKLAGKETDPRELLKILWVPTLSFQDQNGGHSFCRFMLQCRLHTEVSSRHPHDERYEGSVIVEIIQLIRSAFPEIPKDLFSYRLSTLTLMFVSSVVEFDNQCQQSGRSKSYDYRPILDMALAALSAPQGA